MSKIEEITKIVNFLKKYKIENATINKVNDDFIVDVDDTVFLWRKGLTEIPFQFGKVTGSFDISENKLTSLEGCPRWVGRDFDCSYNKLITLKGCPEYVGRNFDCVGEYITSLEGAPKVVENNFNVGSNPLTSLKGIGKVGGSIYSMIFIGKLEDYEGEL